MMGFLNLGPSTNNSGLDEKEGVRFEDDDIAPYEDAVTSKDCGHHQLEEVSKSCGTEADEDFADCDLA